MASIYDVPQNELIEKVAEELKKIKEIEPPAFAIFVKTGANKERPPVRKDWWYVRSASVLRKIFKLGPVGVSKLRTAYGGKKNRGHKTEEFRKASGNILRKVLQQLEKAGLVKKAEKGVRKGRIITPKGKSLLDKAATAVQKQNPIIFEKKPEHKLQEEKAKKPKKEENVPVVHELAAKTEAILADKNN